MAHAPVTDQHTCLLQVVARGDRIVSVRKVEHFNSQVNVFFARTNKPSIVFS